MATGKKLSKDEARAAARERISYLFEQAEKKFSKDRSLSNRYVAIARKIAMQNKLRLPRELKRRFCKKCHSYLKPGKNCRVRTQTGKIVYTCGDCGHYNRYGYK